MACLLPLRQLTVLRSRPLVSLSLPHLGFSTTFQPISINLQLALTSASYLVDDSDLNSVHTPQFSSSREAAKKICSLYLHKLTSDEKVSFLENISQSYGPDLDSIRVLVNGGLPSEFDKAIAVAEKLRLASTPAYEKLFSKMISEMTTGMPFIVQLRSDLLQSMRRGNKRETLRSLNSSLHYQLLSWPIIGRASIS